MNYSEHIISEIETHSVEGIRECFANGVTPNDLFKGEPLLYELTSEYLRSASFKLCVREFVDHGLVFSDRLLLAVLLDDANMLEEQLANYPEGIHADYTLRCAFTPLYKVSLLHICAEFNHLACAAVLISRGAPVNAIAGVDEFGFGAQTPIFHTVNQINNHSIEMMELLLAEKADISVTVKGLVWGKGYEWETFIPAVNPVSYAMMGLLPQMHRSETVIARTVQRLLQYAHGINYVLPNIPNKYLGH